MRNRVSRCAEWEFLTSVEAPALCSRLGASAMILKIWVLFRGYPLSGTMIAVRRRSDAMTQPVTQYSKSCEVYISYQITGSGVVK
jgi:hypothetical protein